MSGSSAKRDRRSRATLLDNLMRNMSFLERSAAAYDEGLEDEACRMAVCVRILVHDAKNSQNSQSLLRQLGLKQSVRFTDTSIWPKTPPPFGGVILTPGFIYIRTINGRGRYHAPLGDVVPSAVGKVKPFDGWWTDPVMREPSGRETSRDKFVLVLANREGGAHVDPKLDHQYEDLVTRNSLRWTNSSIATDGSILSSEAFDSNAVFAAVRQIAFEVMDTFKRCGDLT